MFALHNWIGRAGEKYLLSFIQKKNILVQSQFYN